MLPLSSAMNLPAPNVTHEPERAAAPLAGLVYPPTLNCSVINLKSRQGCQGKSSKSQIPAIVVRWPSKQLLALALLFKYSQPGADVASLSLSFKRENGSIFILNSKILVTAQLYHLLVNKNHLCRDECFSQRVRKMLICCGKAGQVPGSHPSSPRSPSQRVLVCPSLSSARQRHSGEVPQTL